MTPSDKSDTCAWCELAIERSERGVRLSTSQPPWTYRRSYAAASAAAAAASFAASIRAALEDVDVTLWFHRACWDKFEALLRGSR